MKLSNDIISNLEQCGKVFDIELYDHTITCRVDCIQSVARAMVNTRLTKIAKGKYLIKSTAANKHPGSTIIKVLING